MESLLMVKLLSLVCLFYQICPRTVGKSFKEDTSMTYEQKVILDKFKNMVVSRLPHDWMKNDLYLIRWLRARNFILKDSENMLMNYVTWREENNMDNILNEDWSEYRREYKVAVGQSKDKEGRPVLYAYAGEWDIRKAIVSGKSARLARYSDMILEETCSKVREMSQTYKNMSQGVLLINAQGFNANSHICVRCIPFHLRVVVDSELHHPGCCEKIIVTNVPSLAEPIIQAARSLFSPATNEVFRVLGTNKKVLKDTLLQYFDEDQLPIELGGTNAYKYLGEDENDYDL